MDKETAVIILLHSLTGLTVFMGIFMLLATAFMIRRELKPSAKQPAPSVAPAKHVCTVESATLTDEGVEYTISCPHCQGKAFFLLQR